MLPIIDPNQPMAIDLETCDPELKFTAPGFISKVGFVAGIAIHAKEGSWYIPIGHKKGNNYDKEEVVRWLNHVVSADTDKVFHNGQYDIGWLKSVGVELHGRVFDTMLAAPLLDENRFSYQLDALGKSYFGEGKFEESLKLAVAAEFQDVKTHKTVIRLKENIDGIPQTFAEKERTTQFYDIWPKEVQDRYEVIRTETDKYGHETFKVPCKRADDVKALLWAVDPEEMGTYPIQDVDLTFKLYEEFKPLLKEQKLTELMDLENELVVVLLEMREKGVRIDMEKAKELDVLYSNKLDDLQSRLNELAGFNVDVNIDDDLIRLCEKFDLKYSKTPKGNPCFASEAVPKHEAFDIVLEIRKYFKARDTYIRGYIFGSTIDGWLHGQYNQLKSDDAGTVTGRLSSSCIAEGTLISVPGGHKKIEDVQVGEQVYCYKDDGTLTVSTVLNKVDKGIKECVKVKWQSSGDGSTGELICTPDHLIKTKHKGWVPAQTLHICDEVFSVNNEKAQFHVISSNDTFDARKVWDLEVEEHHNFIANEICVHNCPNMQNLPNPKSSQIGKDIRGLFLPDNDKEKWLSMDYSGQEPKMLVHTVLALEKFMRKRFPDAPTPIVPGSDIAKLPEFAGREADFHTAVATICVKKEFELEHTTPTQDDLKAAAKKFRPKAKSIGLGVMYGSGNKKVAEELTKKGFPMSTEDAAAVRQSIYDGVPFLKYLSDYLMRLAKDRGYIKTILGRRGRFDIWECPVYNEDLKRQIGSSNFGFKTSEEAWVWYNENRSKYKDLGRPQRAMVYKALNKYIQGSSADQTKTAMLHLYKRNMLDLNALDIYYRRLKDFVPPKFKTQVHDELNISLMSSEDFKWYQEVMENCVPLEVESVADPVVCTRWSEAK